MAGEVTTHTEVAAHGAEKAVFPPFDTTTFSSQLVWLAIIFGLLYLIMSRVALPRIGSILEERNDRIAGDNAEAERLNQNSEKAREDYNAALAESRSKAQALASQEQKKVAAKLEKKRAAAEAKLAEKIAAAEAHIAEIREKAMGEVGGIASDTAEAVVANISAKVSNSKEIKVAVDAVLKE